jgi:hypothetical protein
MAVLALMLALLLRAGDTVAFASDAGGLDPVAHIYAGTASMVGNPERGFRHEIDSGCDAGGIMAKTLAQLAQFNLTVAQTYCYLPNATKISSATVQRMDTAFASLRGAGVKALWRFAYDRAMPGENFYTTETILGHIEQLQPAFKKHYDALYVLQAGFIGSWGEFHSSQTNIHANASAVSRIVEAELFSLLPDDRKINVRVPVYKLSGVLRRLYRVTTQPAPPPPPAVCEPPTPSRVVCPGAFGGIGIAKCEALGCCFFVNQTKPGPQCYRKGPPAQRQQVPVRASPDDRMAFGIASDGTSNTAVARVGFDNDGERVTTLGSCSLCCYHDGHHLLKRTWNNNTWVP